MCFGKPEELSTKSYQFSFFLRLAFNLASMQGPYTNTLIQEVEVQGVEEQPSNWSVGGLVFVVKLFKIGLPIMKGDSRHFLGAAATGTTLMLHLREF